MLLKAAMNGSLEDVKAACEAGADINAQHPEWGTALFIACQEHHSRIARYLLEQPGIDVTKGRISLYPQGIAGLVYLRERTEHNHTPLYAAVKAGNVRITRMLLNHADKDKYLQPDENWATCIKSTFNYGGNPFGVSPIHDTPSLHFEKPCIFDILLEAVESLPELHLFTLSCALQNSLCWFIPDRPIMAEYIRNCSARTRELTFNCLTDFILQAVRTKDTRKLANCLTSALVLGSAEQLRPYLQAAYSLALQLQHAECAEILAPLQPEKREPI